MVDIELLLCQRTETLFPQRCTLNSGLGTPSWVCNWGLAEVLYRSKFKGHCHCVDFLRVEVVAHQAVFICLPEMNLTCFANQSVCWFSVAEAGLNHNK